METLTHEKLRAEGLPAGAHLLELVDIPARCRRRAAAIECVPLAKLPAVASRYSTLEPIVIHCERPGQYDEAARELGRLGHTHIYRFEGEIEELEPYAATLARPRPQPGPEEGREAPVIDARTLGSLLDERGELVHMFYIVPDATRCPLPTAGVTCLEPSQLQGLGLDYVACDRTIVLRCVDGVDCREMARAAHRAGFGDVRIFEGGYREIVWRKRL
jgi:rhodanese-related sulfurtransferase